MRQAELLRPGTVKGQIACGKAARWSSDCMQADGRTFWASYKMSRQDAWSLQKLAPAPLGVTLGPMSSHSSIDGVGGGGALGGGLPRGGLGGLPGRGLGELLGVGTMDGLGPAGGGGTLGGEGFTQQSSGLGNLKVHKHLCHTRKTMAFVLEFGEQSGRLVQ